MTPIEQARRYYEQEGAVLVRIDVVDTNDGHVTRHGHDIVTPYFLVAENSVGFISVEDIKPHAFYFDEATIDCDDVNLVGHGQTHRIVVSPLWLAEQRAQLAEFNARIRIPDQMKEELAKFVMALNNPPVPLK